MNCESPLTRQYLYNGMIEGFEHCSSGHHNHIITIVLPHISEMMPDMSSRGQLDADPPIPGQRTALICRVDRFFFGGVFLWTGEIYWIPGLAIQFVDLPSYKIVIFNSYVSLPEGIFSFFWSDPFPLILFHWLRHQASPLMQHCFPGSLGYSSWAYRKRGVQLQHLE